MHRHISYYILIQMHMHMHVHTDMHTYMHVCAYKNTCAHTHTEVLGSMYDLEQLVKSEWVVGFFLSMGSRYSPHRPPFLSCSFLGSWAC